MKNGILLLFTLSFLFCACNQENQSIVKKDGQSVVANNSGNSDEQETLIDLENKNSKDIIGLWKLYKTVYMSGASLIERDNNFLEIKENKKLDDNGRECHWFLSFCNDSTGLVTLLTKVQQYRSDELEIRTFKIEKTNENNTTYLKLIALTDGRQLYFIRQQ